MYRLNVNEFKSALNRSGYTRAHPQVVVGGIDNRLSARFGDITPAYCYDFARHHFGLSILGLESLSGLFRKEYSNLSFSGAAVLAIYRIIIPIIAP